MNLAYCTLATNERYLEGANLLYQSYLRTESKYPFFVMVWADVDLTGYEELPVKFVEHTGESDLFMGFRPVQSNTDDMVTMSKLGAFSCVAYDYVMFIDADNIITENLDEDFEQMVSIMSEGAQLFVRKYDENYLQSTLNIKNLHGLYSSWFIAKPDFKTYKLITRNIIDSINEENLFYNLWINNKLQVCFVGEKEDYLDPLNSMKIINCPTEFLPNKYWESEEGMAFYYAVLENKYYANEFVETRDDG